MSDQEFQEWERETDRKASAGMRIGIPIVIAVAALALIAALFFGGN